MSAPDGRAAADLLPGREPDPSLCPTCGDHLQEGYDCSCAGAAVEEIRGLHCPYCDEPLASTESDCPWCLGYVDWSRLLTVGLHNPEGTS